MKPTVLEPTEDRLVIRQTSVKGETRTDSGIILPENARAVPAEGTVIAVGPEVRSKIVLGDRVMYGKYSGTEVPVNGEELIIVRETDILARVRGG